MRIEGNLCPSCQMRLKTEYDGEIENVAVERVILSEENRVGIGTFSPSDPKSQDIADLTGSIDFSTITEYGSESDPRAYRFDGELNKANRGHDGIPGNAQMRREVSVEFAVADAGREFQGGTVRADLALMN